MNHPSVTHTCGKLCAQLGISGWSASAESCNFWSTGEIFEALPAASEAFGISIRKNMNN